MRILGIADIVTKDMIESGFNEHFPASNLQVIELDLADSAVELQKINRQIEKEGLDPFDCTEKISREIGDFQPDLIAAHFAPITEECLQHHEGIKTVGLMRGGYENVEVEAASKRDIDVMHTPGRNANAVAEYAVGMMLGELKNISRGHEALKRGEWRRRYPAGDLGRELSSRKVGIVGFGNIGRLIAERLSGFEVELLAHDPFVEKEEMRELGVTKVELDELLRESDVVSLHVRLNEETRGLIGKEELNLMSSDAYLINTARAGLIEEEALYQTLKNRGIAGAAIDVFWQEPLDINHPFTNLDNVTLTPHLAGFSEEALENSPRMLAAQLFDYLKNGDRTHIVN